MHALIVLYQRSMYDTIKGRFLIKNDTRIGTDSISEHVQFKICLRYAYLKSVSMHKKKLIQSQSNFLAYYPYQNFKQAISALHFFFFFFFTSITRALAAQIKIFIVAHNGHFCEVTDCYRKNYDKNVPYRPP